MFTALLPWTPARLILLGAFSVALLTFARLDFSGAAPVGERSTSAEVVAVDSAIMKGGRTRNGLDLGDTRHTHARLRLDDGAETVVAWTGTPAPAVGSRIDVLVTEYDDGSRSVRLAQF